jgi:DNA-binding NtrC family response regulator
MPARAVVVHDDPAFVKQLVSALRAAGHEVAAFADPREAWDHLSMPQRIEVLITGVEFSPGRSNGLALALKARTKRPKLHVLFTAQLELSQATAGLGTFMEPPVTVPTILSVVTHWLTFEDAHLVAAS